MPEQDENRRDNRRGRFAPGRSGNPAGRPKKKADVDPEVDIDNFSDDEIDLLSKAKLVERLRDPKTPAYALPKITERLEHIAEREWSKSDRTHWSRSVQVRPDWSPPTWETLIRECLRDGAFTREELKAWAGL